MKHQQYEMGRIWSSHSPIQEDERRLGLWAKRLRAMATSRGFRSVSHFVDAHPLRSLEELGRELCGNVVGRGKVIGRGRIEIALFVEARQENVVEERARDVLARALASLPGGWPGPRPLRTHRQERYALEVLADWLPGHLQDVDLPTLASISAALLSRSDLPAGWVPIGGDDPVIVDIFQLLWPKAIALDWKRRMCGVNRALGVIAIKCAELHSAVNCHSIDRAELAARDVHDFWLAARAVFIRLTSREGPSNPYMDGAKASLGSRHRIVVDLLESGAREFADTRLHPLLVELRRSLLSAIHEPTSLGPYA